jgi:hypothetical protein
MCRIITLRLTGLVALIASGLYAQRPVLTEDFESGKIDPAVWEQRSAGDATVAVEVVDGAHGKYALHIHVPDTGARNAYAFIVATHLPESVRTHYFGRAYMKVTPSTGNTHNPLIFTGEPGYPISKFQEIGTYRATWQPSYQENKSPQGQGRGEVTFHGEAGPPPGKWFLLEWEFNDNPTTITMWLDGEKVMSAPSATTGDKTDLFKFMWPRTNGSTSNLTGGYQEFGFGTRVWGTPMPPLDVYYDDVAISTTRIGPSK